MQKRALRWAFVAGLTLALPTAAMAATCIGHCGTYDAAIPSAEDVIAPEGSGGYTYVTTASFDRQDVVYGGGTLGAGLGSEYNGSTYTSDIFSGLAGQTLSFLFNYVTTDGSGFADYAWATLNSDSGEEVVLLTARTTALGVALPGGDMPPMEATLTPAHGLIETGYSNWFALGESSGECYDGGCGRTGWVRADYQLLSDGLFQLVFGVTNWADDYNNSALAFTRITLDNEALSPVSTVPEPAQWALLVLGFGMVGSSVRRRKAYRLIA